MVVSFHIIFQEGKNVSSLMEEAKKRNLTFREYTPEGGETIEEVQSRVEAFYNVRYCTIVTSVNT